MKQAKINLAAGLKASAALTVIVGPRISDAWPSSTATYPRIAYLQISGLGEVADGRTIGFDEVYQVSLFAKPEPGKPVSMLLEDMAEAVLDVADSLGMTMIGNQDMILEDGSGVKHKPLRFRYVTRRR